MIGYMWVVEDCFKLTVSDVPRQGRFRITRNGRSVGVTATPDRIGLLFGPCEGQVIERIKLNYGGRAHGGYTRWFICPICGRKTTALFLPPDSTQMACLRCHNLGYEAWKKPAKTRIPKRADKWLAWFGRKASRILRKEGRT